MNGKEKSRQMMGTKIIRRVATIAWVIFGFYQMDKFQDANDMETKIDAIFWMLYGCFLLGVILAAFLEDLLRPLQKPQSLKEQKDTIA